jgi:hypothetical protein
MNEIIVTKQSDFDALPEKFDEYTRIYIQATTLIVVARKIQNSSVVARGNSSVEAWENSSVVAWGNSSVVARGNSSVVARENSSVVARGNSSVVARENSSVVARENSSVEAWVNSSVVARVNSSVVARGNSSVVARENSSVEAWENSSVEAWENVGVHLFSDYATVALFMFAVCWQIGKGKIKKNAKTATIIKPKPTDWFDANAVEKTKTIILYKRVSTDFKTQEGTSNETLWAVGSTVEHPHWEPKSGECGPGKFHACSRTYFCDEFRSNIGDRYVAIEVALTDTHTWKNPSYPHKIAFRKGTVLYEVNRFGKKI